jgi:hypothetical protein
MIACVETGAGDSGAEKVHTPQTPKTNRLFVPAVVIVSISTAYLPLLAAAWYGSRIIHDDFGTEISPAVQWLMNWQTAIFLVIAVLCVSVVAMLCSSVRNHAATLAVIAIGIGVILAEVAIMVWCIIQPAAKLIEDIS